MKFGRWVPTFWWNRYENLKTDVDDVQKDALNGVGNKEINDK
jgi:hypothetical protein